MLACYGGAWREGSKGAAKGQRAQSGRDGAGHLDGQKMGRVGLAFLAVFSTRWGGEN
jgi:hypothetical protein